MHKSTRYEHTLKNPMNLGEVHAILDETLQRTLKQTSKNIFMAIAEVHAAPAYKLSTICLLDSVLRHQKKTPSNLMLAFEQPYNQLEKYAQKKFGLDIPESVRSNLHQYDDNGRLILQTSILAKHFNQAPYSKKLLFNYALTNNIPTVFNDAAHQGRNIDANDPVARRLAMDLFELDLGLYDLPYSSDKQEGNDIGVEIRNAEMAHRVMEASKELKPRIIIQQTGAGHIEGLMEQFKNNGYQSIGIWFDENLRSKELSSDHIYIDIKGVTKSMFTQNFLFGINNMHLEPNYVSMLRETYSYNESSCPFSDDFVEPDENECANDIRKAIQSALAIFPTIN